MLTILHISDFHFGPPYVSRVGESFLKIAPQLNADIIVASGDFTQRAKPEQFAQARNFLDQLPPVPLIVTPGNHDVPLYRVNERIRDPYQNYRKYISAELDSVTRHNDAVIVSLNSTSPLRTITNGRISSRQLAYCAAAFEESPSQAVRIVVAHHHFAPAPDYLNDQVMRRGKRALDRFVELKVDLVLGGHLHRCYIGNSLDVYPGEDRERGVIIVQAGTATSRRGRGREKEKNSFNLIHIDEDRLRVTHFMFFDDVGGFARLSSHLFPRAGKRLPDDD